jgi:hypothetical protein
LEKLIKTRLGARQRSRNIASALSQEFTSRCQTQSAALWLNQFDLEVALRGAKLLRNR